MRTLPMEIIVVPEEAQDQSLSGAGTKGVQQRSGRDSLTVTVGFNPALEMKVDVGKLQWCLLPEQGRLERAEG